MADVMAQPAAPMFSFEPNNPYDMAHPQHIPDFSFPLRAQSDVHTRDASVNSTDSSAGRRTHRRARTSVNIPPPLPSFSFGAASSNASDEPQTPPGQPSSRNSLAPGPSTSRHRRAVSELVGERSEGVSGQASGQRAFHRHRRSGAVSSQDLSALNLHNTPVPAGPVPQDTQTVPARTLESVDDVKLLPRPLSMISSESNSSSSTIRDSRPVTREDATTTPTTQSLPSFSADATTQQQLSVMSLGACTAVDIVELNENFDVDPTSAIMPLAGPELIASTPTYSHHVPTFSLSATPSKRTNDTASDAIDLDLASADLDPSPSRSSARATRFKQARASMHSAGLQSGSMTSSLATHRRTESAPTLAPTLLSMRSIEKAEDAGFFIEDVFEEEEEEEAIQIPTQLSPVIEAAHQPSRRRRSSGVVPRPLTGKRDVHTSPSLLPAIQLERTRSVSEADEDDMAFEVPKPPFTSYDESGSSSRSSPKYAHSGVSSCEPSPGFRPSVEDVPSLISSASTIGSATQSTFPDGSFRHLGPADGFARSTSSLAPSSRAPSSRKHRKRLSLMSMSVSKLFSGNSSRLDVADEQATTPTEDCPAFGSTPPTKSRRLSRVIKFWRKSSP